MMDQTITDPVPVFFLQIKTADPGIPAADDCRS